MTYSRMPEDKLSQYRKTFENCSNVYDAPEIIRDFWMRCADEKMSHLFSQNLSWLGFHHAPFSDETESADVVIYGIGYDMNSSQEMGDTRHAPMYLRQCSKYLPPVHDEWKIAPFEMCNIIDRGDIDKFSMEFNETLEWDFQHALEWSKNGALPLRIGGDHEIFGGTMVTAEMLARKYFPDEAMGIVMFDGHSDCFLPNDVGGYIDTDWVNGGGIPRAIYNGWVDPEKVFQFGMRGFGIDGAAGRYAAQELGITLVSPLDLERKGCDYYTDMIRERCGQAPMVMTCDLDALDPSQGGGTTQRDGFGMTFREMQMINRSLKGMNLIAADISEYAPSHDTHGRSTGFNVAALIFETMCMLADTKYRLNGEVRNPTKWDLNLSTSRFYHGQTFLERWKQDKAQGK
ncbi:arginase family protein [Vibrio maritimus]|uniref:arginase family protein n=1 Tax=Vibrio maritimus TaxID=990268 RepID=UPI001F2A9067|nr:arginase family protein [Vibrio maritimus]